MHAVQVAVRIEKSEGGSGAKKERREIREHKRNRNAEFVKRLDRLSKKRVGKERRRGERMWCKHLLITICRTDTHTLYSLTV